MKIVLQQLKIRNFKGIKLFDFLPKADLTKVFGKNGAGKTTLYDAFSWCLFGKNSLGESDFAIKPVDVNNNPVHHLEIEVEATLSIDGKPISLKRNQVEKWVKKRGTKEKVFEGNTVSYTFDGIPMETKSEYDKRVENSIMNEATFRVITNLNHFLNMNWKDKRKMLFEISGNVSDQDVVNSNAEKLQGFIDLLEGKSLNDYRKKVKAEIKEIKKDMKSIPDRIDEVDRIRPQTPAMSLEDVNAKIQEQNTIKSNVQSLINDVAARNAKIDAAIKAIGDKKRNLSNLEFTINSDANKAKTDAFNQLNNKNIQLNNFENKVNSILNNIENKKNDIKKIEESNVKLREDYSIEFSKQFKEPNRSTMICSCCNQPLPSDNIEVTINNMKVNFENAKAQNLAKIQKTGGDNNVKIENLKSEISLLAIDLENLKNQISIARTETENLASVANQDQIVITDFSKYPQYVALETEIKNDEAALSETEDTQSLYAQINAANEEISRLKDIVKIYNDINANDKRKQELVLEEETFSKKLLELENNEFKCEEFIRTKVDLTDDKINSMFKFVKFKMFEKQVNGNIIETCKPLVNTNGALVEYRSANTAGQINAGIDIVNALSNFYGVSAPIFIDHNESITEILESQSQIIGLYVSEQHEVLTTV